MNHIIKTTESLSAATNLIEITFSKYGLIEIKSSMLDDSLEIVRRRVDEVGTKEPTIIRRGNDRILIELPGLDDPNRIKNLLGKTAKGIPTQYFVERFIDKTTITLYLTPGAAQDGNKINYYFKKIDI